LIKRKGVTHARTFGLRSSKILYRKRRESGKKGGKKKDDGTLPVERMENIRTQRLASTSDSLSHATSAVAALAPDMGRNKIQTKEKKGSDNGVRGPDFIGREGTPRQRNSFVPRWPAMGQRDHIIGGWK